MCSNLLLWPTAVELTGKPAPATPVAAAAAAVVLGMRQENELDLLVQARLFPLRATALVLNLTSGSLCGTIIVSLLCVLMERDRKR